MKLISLFVLGVLAVAMSASAQAQTTDPIKKETTDPIKKALLAAPNAAMAKDATVIKWKPDFTYEVLKKGAARRAESKARGDGGGGGERSGKD